MFYRIDLSTRLDKPSKVNKNFQSSNVYLNLFESIVVCLILFEAKHSKLFDIRHVLAYIGGERVGVLCRGWVPLSKKSKIKGFPMA